MKRSDVPHGAVFQYGNGTKRIAWSGTYPAGWVDAHTGVPDQYRGLPGSGPDAARLHRTKEVLVLWSRPTEPVLKRRNVKAGQVFEYLDGPDAGSRYIAWDTEDDWGPSGQFTVWQRSLGTTEGGSRNPGMSPDAAVRIVVPPTEPAKEPEPYRDPKAPPSAAILTTDKKARKEMPIARGVVDYFPLALAEVARVSFKANEQHNPGEPMHWDKSKSTDHADCIARHLIERGGMDDDGLRHTAKLAWRALALLQTELEAAGGAK